MSFNYNYQTQEELYKYLNKLSYAIYGTDYNSLTFLNGNKQDFSYNNILVNCK